jgi:hypothetical protein
VKKNRSKNYQLVTLSAAAVCLFPFPQKAEAQMVFNCLQNLEFGTFAIGGGGGRLRVRPTAGTVRDLTDVIAIAGGQQGICKVSNITGTTGTLELKVLSNKIDISGPGNIKVNNFDIGTQKGGRTKTFTNADLTNKTVTFNLGATLHAMPSESIGTYTGALIIRATYTN